MATITKTFEMVEAHNHEWLNAAIKDDMNRKKILWRTVKKGVNIIGKAIQVHARECFDLLLQVPTIKEMISDTTYCCGFDIAYQNYLNNSVEENEYYIIKLLDSGYKLDLSAFKKVANADNINMFERFFNKIEKTHDTMIRLITHFITIGKLSYFNKMIAWLDETMPPYYNNHVNKVEFIEKISNSYFGYRAHSIEYFMDILVSKGLNWKNNVIKIFKSDNMLFDYLYNKLKELPVEELNEIPNIKNLVSYGIIEYNQNSNNNNNINVYKYLKLPIEYVNVMSSVYTYMISLLNSNEYSSRYIIIYMLLLKYKLDDNTINMFITQAKEYIKGNNTYAISSYKIKTMRIIYLLEQTGHIINELPTIYELFGCSKATKNIFIEDIDKQYTTIVNVVEPKPVQPKAPRKKAVKKVVEPVNELEI